MAIKPKYYMQNKSPWSTHNYSAIGEKKTISSSGCGPTSAAMILQTLRPDKTITPITCANWSMANNFKVKSQGTAYTYFRPQFKKYGISCSQINTSNLYHKPNAHTHVIAKKLLQNGYFLIAVMGPGTWTKGGHYVVAWKVDDNGYVYINDPASTATNRVKNRWSIFKNEVKYYWAVSYGKEYKLNLPANLYKHMDIKMGKYSSHKKGMKIFHIKDLKNGWSIVADKNYVGYMKNSAIDAELSNYLYKTVTVNATLRKNNSKTAKKMGTITAGSKVQVITKRKYWTNVIYLGNKGWVSTKKIKF